jgi:uncharacterized repeat protein (TIGR01451 family)
MLRYLIFLFFIFIGFISFTSVQAQNIQYLISNQAGRVVINEVLYKGVGTNAATNDEFIEIYNPSKSAVDISSWQLTDGNLIVNDVDGIGSITGVNSPYIFPTGTILKSREYAVIWVGIQPSIIPSNGATFQTWLGKSPKLNNSGDDIWLYDEKTQIVDYIAYGSGTGINTPPPSSIWNNNNQAKLALANTGQSISLATNGVDRNTSICWEITTSANAKKEGCADYIPTINTDKTSNHIISVGESNHLIAKLLLVKRITAINGKTNIGNNDLSKVINDPNTEDDNHYKWNLNYLKGDIKAVINPGDIIEYTIYFLSSGNALLKNVTICDFISASQIFIPNSLSNNINIANSGIELRIGNSSSYLTNSDDGDKGEFIPPYNPTPSFCNQKAFSKDNPHGAIVVKVVSDNTTLPDISNSGADYGLIRFRVKVN